MALLIKAGETTATNKHVYFQCVDAADGLSPETGEADGQPQISTNGAAFTNTGIGTLVAIGNGRYYAVLTDGTVDTASRIIESRYKSAETAEAIGTTVQVVAFDPHAIANLGLTNIDAIISSRGTADPGDQMDLQDEPNATAITAIQADLAVEETLTAIKGDDWSDETLVAIAALITALADPSLAEILAGIVAAHGSGDYNKGGAIVLSAESLELTVTGGEVVGDDGSIAVTRDDTPDIQWTLTDQDITGYTIYMTVRSSLTEDEDDDDSEALFQLEGVLTTPGSGVFTFSLSKTQTDKCTVGTKYWYDVCAFDGDGKIDTLIKAPFEVTGDVTRRIAVA